MNIDLIDSFFTDLSDALLFFIFRCVDFFSFFTEYPLTYYCLFALLVVPALYFLIDWLQDFVSDDIGKNSIGRHNPLPPNVYYKEKEGIRGFNRFIRFSRFKRIKEIEMKRGRIYKTKTLAYKGKKYRYVTSEQAPKDFQGDFNTDE